MQKIVPAGSKISAALLRMDDLNLLLPQGEIRSLESSGSIDTVSPALRSTGWITYAQKRWPVYCLSAALTLQTVAPVQRRACALLSMGAGFIGIMCDDMLVLQDTLAQRYEIPLAMRLPGSPLLHLVNYEQGIACVSNSRQMTSYVERLVLNA